MTEQDMSGRLGHVEGVLKTLAPQLDRMEKKIDKALDLIGDKASKDSVAGAHDEIENIKLQLEKKADRTEFYNLRLTIAMWAGGGIVASAVLSTLVSMYGAKLLTILAQ